MTTGAIEQPQRVRIALERLRTPTMASVLGAVLLLSIPASFVLNALIHQLPASTGDVASGAAGVAFVLAFTGVGVVVARRQPSNPLGWMLIAVALAVQASDVGPAYVQLDYAIHHRSLPLGHLALLASGSWLWAFVLLPLIILLFPDARLGSRWRWPVRAYLVLAALTVVGTFTVAASDFGLRNPFDNGGNLVGLNHPSGANAWFGVIQPIALLACVLLTLAAIAHQALTFHRASGERRQQQKWLASGALVLVVCIVINKVSGGGSGFVGDVSFSIGLAAVPLGIGVGILKYRLYEIDRLVSRTLAYAILSGLLIGTFIGLVALTTDVLPFSSSVGVAASTLAAAALFNPLRGRVQRVVDRRFNRARYDAEETVAAFAARLRDAVDLDAVQAELLEVVQRTVEPSHSTIWIRTAPSQADMGQLR
jgi:hypothetical protein